MQYLNIPFFVWFKWFFHMRLLLIKHKKKHLKIGNMTYLHNVILGNYNTFYNNSSIYDSKIDDFVYVGDNTIIINSQIGKYCSIGSNIKIGIGMHPVNYISTFPAFFSTRKQCQITFVDRNHFEESGLVIIGNDVWIGSNSIIMDNIRIGDGAIIAAGAVVTKNVEPYSIVGGVPARLIKKRFSNIEIEKLQNFKWWEKDFRWIKDNHLYFNNSTEFFKLINDNTFH